MVSGSHVLDRLSFCEHDAFGGGGIAFRDVGVVGEHGLVLVAVDGGGAVGSVLHLQAVSEW